MNTELFLVEKGPAEFVFPLHSGDLATRLAQQIGGKLYIVTVTETNREELDLNASETE
jgi:hypothetical protein